MKRRALEILWLALFLASPLAIMLPSHDAQLGVYEALGLLSAILLIAPSGVSQKQQEGIERQSYAASVNQRPEQSRQY